jgi:hypothetical protein
MLPYFEHTVLKLARCSLYNLLSTYVNYAHKWLIILARVSNAKILLD